VPAHPIRHDEQATLGQHEVVVFVLGANHTDVRSGSTSESHDGYRIQKK
jgi:hypothetical protein